MRWFAIGDIHGSSVALRTLLQAIDPQPLDTIVTLGDVIDWGPDSRGVVEQLIELSTQCRYLSILGNHEELLLGSLADMECLKFWLSVGGQATLESYRDQPGRSLALNRIPDHHVDFLRRALPFLETESHLLVHASYEPSRPLEQTASAILRWEFLDRSIAPHRSGKTVVVGHTCQESGEVLDLGHLIGLDTNANRGGWLSALELGSGEILQASQLGEIRRGRLAPWPRRTASPSCRIRPESPSDSDAIRAIHLAAFGGEAEGRLVDDLRAEGFARVSLVAVDGQGQVIGHLLFSTIEIQSQSDKSALDALSLAPVAVLPAHQRRGVGASLIEQGLEACRQAGHTRVIVLGHPEYYPRFGFSAELAQRLDCPFPGAGPAFMALELVPGSLQGVNGRVVYPPPFQRL